MPAPALNDRWDCRYGDVIFDSYIRTHVHSRPRYDEAGRTIVLWEYSIYVKGFINTAGSDAVMSTIRKSLQVSGAQLRYEKKGFGTIIVNNGEIFDCDFGPKPRLLNFD